MSRYFLDTGTRYDRKKSYERERERENVQKPRIQCAIERYRKPGVTRIRRRFEMKFFEFPREISGKFVSAMTHIDPGGRRRAYVRVHVHIALGSASDRGSWLWARFVGVGCKIPALLTSRHLIGSRGYSTAVFAAHRNLRTRSRPTPAPCLLSYLQQFLQQFLQRDFDPPTVCSSPFF